ncbi:unnamed protein product [Adineta ricciae]|nr:unnamed protein product [Adineta ricciae]
MRKLNFLNMSLNEIERIHPFTFNDTSIEFLDLSSNLISSLETIIIVYDEEFKPKNQITSFLYSLSETLDSISLINCKNLKEINWNIFTKLKQIVRVDLSGIPRSDKFWLLESRDDTPIVWNQNVIDFQIVLNNIPLNNKDYCLSKELFNIFNQSTLFLYENHPCTCFTFMWKKFIYPRELNCLANQTIFDELTKECENIDYYCSSMITSTIKPTRNKDEKWKIILAIIIPVVVITIVLSFIGFYMIKRRNKKNLKENVEIKGGIVNLCVTK